MNILIVSTYPPMVCGVGAYAEQQVRALRGEGHVVDVLSPEEGDGDWTDNLSGGMRVLRLLKYVWAYQRVDVHFTPQFFFNHEKFWSSVIGNVAWLKVLIPYGRRFNFIIHETSYDVDRPTEHRGLRSRIERVMWRFAGKVTFHSEREREAFAACYRMPPSSPRFEVVEHGRHFAAHCSMTREEARRELSLPPDKTLFLCIGFIQPHKGFDRAFRALREVPSSRALLRVVGSVRMDWKPVNEYARNLHQLSAMDARSEFVETHLTDEQFDMWIIAADYVLLPYERIWSSSVAARAQLLERPVIASNAGGLVDQVREGRLRFNTNAELVEIMKSILHNGA